jgi:two-component system, OmpR family, phosphate regulon sensor histidine kinase PhoR
MTPRPFLLRLLLPFALIMAAIVVVCGAAIYWADARAVRVEQIRQLDNLTALVRPWVAADNESFDAARQAQLRAAAEALRTRVTLLDGAGHVFFDTWSDPRAMENHNDRPEVLAARHGQSGSDVRTSRTIREGSVYVAKLLDPNNANGTVVRLSYPQRYWADLRTPAWTVLAAGVVCALLATAVLAAMLLRQWINPVRDLASAAERMAAGEWDVRATPRGAEDLRLFSGRLNVVAAQAQKQLADLRDQRADLAALVDTLPDPFLVTDAHRRILLMNAPAATLLQLTAEQAVGRTVDAVVNEAAVLELFDPRAETASSTTTNAALPREIRLTRDGQRLVHQAMVTPTAAGGMLLVLRDVSELSHAVQMKADFVANASHELRTPIATIKIAFDTLRDVYRDDPQQAERCIGIIDEHVRRLEEMLRDLLDLSRVESPDLKPHLTRVNAADLFVLLRATMGPVARQKGVELQFTDGDAQLVSDERLLNLVLKNLVENSIKFTPTGGRVTVAVHANGADGAPVTLSVVDTGVGIPPEHIDRVFERFYQSNAARSGSAGRGTGLGLAIVKHAIAALGGAVTLESEVGRGTTVTCVLPQREDME